MKFMFCGCTVLLLLLPVTWVTGQDLERGATPQVRLQFSTAAVKLNVSR
jgi:hypothetical protein